MPNGLLKTITPESALIKKYNVSGPRYTSYPTVPYWSDNPSREQWAEKVRIAYNGTASGQGISLYIHLPFCESLCTYCGCNTRITTNHSVENPYIRALAREWKMYLGIFGSRPRISEIHLGGGTPTFFSPSRLEELMDEILSSSELLPSAELSFEAHPNSTSLTHLEVLHRLGFRRMSLGIQDFDPRVQAIVNRVQTFGQVEKVVNHARATGYNSINFDLIYGLPLQQESSVVGTIEKVNRIRPDRIAFYSYAHVPWIKPGQRKFTEADLPADDVKRKLYESGRRMLEDAGYTEIGMDHFALATDALYAASEKGTLHRNFMGYTASYTGLMIGLGVSAIGDTWDCFAQNVKKVEDYYRILENGRLPVFRGHLLDKEDLVLRRHILNIMCRLETSWGKNDMKVPVLDDCISRLSEPLSDGLITLSHSSLRVTGKGKAFLRNICMAFDARLWRNIPASEIFSKVV